MALLDPSFRLDERIAKAVKEPESKANLLQLCHQMIEAEILTIDDEILCDGKIKACLQVKRQSDDKTHLIEIVEDELVHFEGGEEDLKMRARSRMVDAVAKDHGYSGYSCLSFEELENAPNEMVFF